MTIVAEPAALSTTRPRAWTARLDQHLPLVAGAIAFVVYWATRATVPTEWDSVQLALGVDRFDVRQDSPHAPGYWAYIGLGRLIRALTPLGTVPALTLASVLAGAGTVALVAWLGRELGGRRLAIAAALVLGTTPFMWFYSVTISTYAFDALGSAALMLLAWKALPGRWHGAAAAATLGLTGGFRQTSLIVLFPIALVAVAVVPHAAHAWIAAAAAGAAAIAVWFVPMLLEQPGGYDEISYNNRLFWDASAKRTSLFTGGFRREVYDNVSQLTAHTVVTLGPVFLVGALAALAVLLQRRHGRVGEPDARRAGWLTPVRLLLVAAVPPFLFCALFHFGKAGYVLSFLPAGVLLALLPIAYLHARWRAVIGAAIAVVALFGAQRFLAGDGVLPEDLLERRPWFTHAVYGAPFSGTRHVIQQTEAQQPTFDDIARRFDPDRDVLVYLLGNGGQYWRNAMYALPEFTIHYEDETGDALVGRGRQAQRDLDRTIEVPPGGNAVFVELVPDSGIAPLEQAGRAERVQLEHGQSAWIVKPGETVRGVTIAETPGILDRPLEIKSAPKN